MTVAWHEIVCSWDVMAQAVEANQNAGIMLAYSCDVHKLAWQP